MRAAPHRRQVHDRDEDQRRSRRRGRLAGDVAPFHPAPRSALTMVVPSERRRRRRWRRSRSRRQRRRDRERRAGGRAGGGGARREGERGAEPRSWSGWWCRCPLSRQGARSADEEVVPAPDAGVGDGGANVDRYCALTPRLAPEAVSDGGETIGDVRGRTSDSTLLVIVDPRLLVRRWSAPGLGRWRERRRVHVDRPEQRGDDRVRAQHGAEVGARRTRPAARPTLPSVSTWSGCSRPRSGHRRV